MASLLLFRGISSKTLQKKRLRNVILLRIAVMACVCCVLLRVFVCFCSKMAKYSILRALISIVPFSFSCFIFSYICESVSLYYNCKTVLTDYHYAFRIGYSTLIQNESRIISVQEKSWKSLIDQRELLIDFSFLMNFILLTIFYLGVNFSSSVVPGSFTNHKKNVTNKTRSLYVT